MVKGKSNPRRSNGALRNKMRARLKAEGRGCWICRAFGRPDHINYDLPAGDPGAFEVDELVPVSKGGSPYDYDNLDAVHRCCNQWRGNKSVREVRAMARGLYENEEKPPIPYDQLPQPFDDW